METLKRLTFKETFFLLLAPASVVFSLTFLRGIIFNIKEFLPPEINKLMFCLISLVIVLFTLYINTISTRMFPENKKKRYWLTLLISASLIYYISLFVQPVAGIFFFIEFIMSLVANVLMCLLISVVIREFIKPRNVIA